MRHFFSTKEAPIVYARVLMGEMWVPGAYANSFGKIVVNVAVDKGSLAHPAMAHNDNFQVWTWFAQPDEETHDGEPAVPIRVLGDTEDPRRLASLIEYRGLVSISRGPVQHFGGAIARPGPRQTTGQTRG